MLKRLARKPSTASQTPATRNSTKATHIAPEAIAHTTIGTSRDSPQSNEVWNTQRRSVPVAGASRNAPIGGSEYNEARTIARLSIVTYARRLKRGFQWQNRGAG